MPGPSTPRRRATAGHGTIYRSASPNVIAVGGTRLNGCSGTSCAGFTSESAWSGSGGGASSVEAIPGYKSGYTGPVFGASTISGLTGGKRGLPDISCGRYRSRPDRAAGKRGHLLGRFLDQPQGHHQWELQRECRTAWSATTRLMIATTTPTTAPTTTITIARMVRPTVTRWGLVLEMACRSSADALMFPVVAAVSPRAVAPDPAGCPAGDFVPAPVAPPAGPAIRSEGLLTAPAGPVTAVTHNHQMMALPAQPGHAGQRSPSHATPLPERRHAPAAGAVKESRGWRSWTGRPGIGAGRGRGHMITQ